jgi:hypothetical protein
MAPGLVGGILAIVVAGMNGWSRYRRSSGHPSADDDGVLENSARYRRYLLAAVAAGGSARDWDYSVRPVLGDLVEAMFARDSSTEDAASLARAVLGEHLWDLVDRQGPPCDDHDVAGPGDRALLEILTRLECGTEDSVGLPRSARPSDR